MSEMKYVALDVHTATTVAAVLSTKGKLLCEAVLETRADSILNFVKGLGPLIHLTYEEGTQAAWLYSLLSGRVDRLLVCDPRQNKLLQAGNKADKLDARRLAELLRLGALAEVYHGHDAAGIRALKEDVHAYDSLVSDCTRTMSRLRAIFRSQAIPTGGDRFFSASKREESLSRLPSACLQQRAEFLFRELDAQMALRGEARKLMLAECRKQPACKILCSVPGLGPVRAAQIIAAVGSPHRFRTKRQFWSYCGLAVITKASAEYTIVGGSIQRTHKQVALRGLNRNCNRRLKHVFKSASLSAAGQAAFKPYYDRLLAAGMRPQIARVTLARKIAATALAVWKKGEQFNGLQMTSAI